MEQVRRQRDTPGSSSRIPGSLPSGAQKSRPAASSLTQQSLVFQFVFFFKTIFQRYNLETRKIRRPANKQQHSTTGGSGESRRASFPQCNILHHEVPAVTACGHKQPDKTKNPTSLMASVSPKERFVPSISTTTSTQKKRTENCPEEQHDRLRASTRPPNAAEPNVIGGSVLIGGSYLAAQLAGGASPSPQQCCGCESRVK